VVRCRLAQSRARPRRAAIRRIAQERRRKWKRLGGPVRGGDITAGCGGRQVRWRIGLELETDGGAKLPRLPTLTKMLADKSTPWRLVAVPEWCGEGDLAPSNREAGSSSGRRATALTGGIAAAMHG
jgi:hypothetical protein